MIKSHQNKKHLVCQRLWDAFQIHQCIQAFPLISATEAFFSFEITELDARGCSQQELLLCNRLKPEMWFYFYNTRIPAGSGECWWILCPHLDVWVHSLEKVKLHFLIIFQFVGVGGGQMWWVSFFIHQLTL